MIGQLCTATIIVDPLKVYASIFSLSLAFLSLIVLKKINFSTKSKLLLIYSHLAFLSFPFILFGTNATCGLFCMSCYTNPINLLLIALPTTIFAGTLIGNFAIPTFFISLNKRREIKNGWIKNFVYKYSKTFRIKSPKIFFLDNSKPVAFSFKSFKTGMFLSIGLFDILNKKEIEAVLLHEFFHLKNGSSMLKCSSSILNNLSPFSILMGFNLNNSEEEEKADRFAIKIQKTDKFLNSAKRKISEFENN